MTRFHSDDWFSLHPKKGLYVTMQLGLEQNFWQNPEKSGSHLLRHNPRPWIPNYPYRQSWVFSQARNLGSHRLAGSCTRHTESCLQKVPTDASSIRMYMFTINHPNFLSMSLFFNHHRNEIMGNTIINHPPVITIFIDVIYRLL